MDSNNTEFYSSFLDKLAISRYILNDMTPAERLNMLDKYNRIAEAILEKTHGSCFKGDVINYDTILDRQVYDLFIRKVSMVDLQNYPSLHRMYKATYSALSSKLSDTQKQSQSLQATIKNNAYKNMHNEMCKKIAETGSSFRDIDINVKNIQVALETFGLGDTDNKKIETEPIVTSDEFTDEDKPIIEFDDMQEDELYEDEYEEEEDTGEAEIYGDEQQDFDIDELLGNDTEEEQQESEKTGEQQSEQQDMPEEETPPAKEEEEEVPEEESEEDKAKRDYFEAFKQIYEGPEEGSSTPLRSAIDGILKSLYDLYMSCYSGITTPDGILTDKGLLSFEKAGADYRFLYNHSAVDLNNVKVTSKEYIAYKQNSGMYNKYYKAIMYGIGVAMGGAQEINIQRMNSVQLANCIENAVKIAEARFGRAIDGRKDPLPKYEDINNINYYPRLHMEFMTGNFKINKEMRKWAEDTKARRNGIKITRFDDVMKWARIRISNCLTQALIDAGLKIEDAGMNDAEVTGICQEMAKKIKNIIVLPNTKKSYFTVKICTSEVINSKLLISSIREYFDSGSAGSKSTDVLVRNDGSGSGVVELDIILNRKDYDSAVQFSADVIDDIIETGNVPRWDNAILGEKNDGGALTYNFKNDSNVSVAIYGASGSGKGVMTSSLLANALADGCAVLYFDGKPDNGAALAKVTWDAGLEGPVFNYNTGKFTGGTCPEWTEPLESYSHGIRDYSVRQSIIDMIPTLDDDEYWPFSTSEANMSNRLKLYEVSMVLKAFDMVQNIIIKRSSRAECIEYLPNGKPRWAVIVMDELEAAAAKEEYIREKIKTYMDIVGEREVYKTETNNKGEQVEKRDGKIKDSKNWSKSVGYSFCKQWLTWADNQANNWKDVATISLRGAKMTLITIFQGNKWFNLSGAVSTGSTSIGQFLLKIVAKTKKIVGKGALQGHNSWGDEENDSYTFGKDLNNSKWVISSAQGTLQNTDTVFKPFRIFTTDLGKDVIVPVDDYGAGSPNCYLSKEEKLMGGKNKPVGLQSYLKYLFNGLQPELQKQLENGERLDGTLTPEGALNTSYNYYNNLFDGHFLDMLYQIEPIVNFNSNSVGESSDSDGADNDLDNLNSTLDDDEDGEPLDFGSYGDNNSSDMPPESKYESDGSQPIPGDKVNNLGQQTSQESGSTVDQMIQETQQIKNLKLMTTNALIRANYSDRVLIEYFNRILNKPVALNGAQKNRVEGNIYNYADRNPKNYGGLKLAAITFSSLVYMESQRGLMDISNIKAQALNQIRTLNDPNDKWKFMLGMLEDYESSELANDEMPSIDRMRYYQQKYMADLGLDDQYDEDFGDGFDGFDPDNAFSDGGNSMSEEEAYWQRMQAIPEEDIYDGHEVFNTGRNGVIDIKPRETQDVVRLSLDDYLEATAPKWHTIERFKKKLFESKNGIAYEFKKRWDYVLNEIAKRFPDRALVRRMAFSELQVAVNGKISMFNNLIGGDDEILVTDILRIRDTFKKFPFIQEMTFDGPTTQCLIDEYGTSAQEIWSIFQENRSLKTIIISVNNNPQKFERSTFANSVDRFNKLMGLQVTKMQLEQFASEYNPRLENKSPGYINRILKNGKSKASSWFKKSRKNVRQSPVVSKRTKVAVGAVGLIAVGSIIGLPGILAAGATGLFGYFKGRR